MVPMALHMGSMLCLVDILFPLASTVPPTGSPLKAYDFYAIAICFRRYFQWPMVYNYTISYGLYGISYGLTNMICCLWYCLSALWHFLLPIKYQTRVWLFCYYALWFIDIYVFLRCVSYFRWLLCYFFRCLWLFRWFLSCAFWFICYFPRFFVRFLWYFSWDLCEVHAVFYRFYGISSGPASNIMYLLWYVLCHHQPYAFYATAGLSHKSMVSMPIFVAYMPLTMVLMAFCLGSLVVSYGFFSFP